MLTACMNSFIHLLEPWPTLFSTCRKYLNVCIALICGCVFSAAIKVEPQGKAVLYDWLFVEEVVFLSGNMIEMNYIWLCNGHALVTSQCIFAALYLDRNYYHFFLDSDFQTLCWGKDKTEATILGNTPHCVYHNIVQNSLSEMIIYSVLQRVYSCLRVVELAFNFPHVHIAFPLR